MKLEYTTVPASQLTGTLNGPIDQSSGLPGDWELFYFGQLGMDPNASVPWSNGTVTNQQASQQGLNPTDFYNGTLPGLTAVTGTSLSETGTTSTISVLVADSNNNPIPGGPVIFTTDYSLLEAPGSSSASQEVEVAADSNGYASVTVLEPLWPDVSYTVTAEVETVGQTPVTMTFYGETGGDDPTKPPIPHPANSNSNQVFEPTLSIETSGTSVANPAFRQFEVYDSDTDQYTDTPPILWYKVSTETAGLSECGNTGATEWTDTGTYNSVGTLISLLSGITWTGKSELIHEECGTRILDRRL